MHRPYNLWFVGCAGVVIRGGFAPLVSAVGLVVSGWLGGRQEGHRCQRTAGLGTQLFHLLFRVLGTL